MTFAASRGHTLTGRALYLPQARAADDEHRELAGVPEEVMSATKPETTTGLTWAKITDEMDLLTLGTFTGPAGTFRQTAELTKARRDLLARLSLPHPKKIIEAIPATTPD